jgi:hypothetical protein
MQPERPAPTALSLQQKLDWVARERDVLALRSELARRGLREGDPVREVGGEARGRLAIARDESPPRIGVRADDGTLREYSPTHWQRA